MGTKDRPTLTRREMAQRLAWGAAALAAGPVAWPRAVSAEDVPPTNAGRTQNGQLRKPPAPPLPKRFNPRLLEQSPFVYISPLGANGKESTCHAELWYAWLDESVVVTVASDRWKATALARGLDRARVWIGDHGRWKTWYGGRNEDFRGAPHFDARVERVAESGMIERLLSIYEEKYPLEIASWRDGMRAGDADGSRVILRYTPV